jgi:signal transduction histidine kinase
VSASPTTYPAIVAFPIGAYLLGLVATAPIVVRRRYPVPISFVVIAAVAAYHFAGYPGASPALVLFVTSYSIGAYGRSTWRSILTASGFIVAWMIIPSLPPHPVAWFSFAITGPALGMAVMVVLGSTAAQVRRNNELRVAAAASEAEARMREELADERLGMARELHDVLAHTISVISVQAGVALDALDDHPDAARTAIMKVRGLSRQAIPELRRTLELLRRDPALGDETAPQPGLDGLPGLLADLESSGLVVESHIAVEGAGLSPFVELTAYRIVQEAVTNVVRHASASTVSVTVLEDADASVLRVTVEDDGRGSAAAGQGHGLGLVGMRERAHSVGGTLETGASRSGGFLVSAVLPIEEPA